MSRWLRLRLAADRAVAALLLILLAPVIGACAWLVHRHDGGPAIIAVPRVGRYGRPIRMWKLRSMRAESPDGMALGVALTAASDSRITPIGRKLRARYLDELPQLYNVVRGEMCLLGPRPEAPDFVDVTDPGWRAVLAVPPGIAGPTQLIVDDWERELITSDRGGTAYVREVLPVKLAIDGWYVGRSTPQLDALIVATLLRRFLPGSPSNTLERRVRAEVPEAARVG